MGTSNLKEIHVSASLYQAYQDKLIPPSPAFDGFAKSHKAFQERTMRTGLFGMLLMPAVTFFLYKNLKNPGLRGGMGLGVCTFYVLFVMPSKPTPEEMAFVRQEGPRYMHILVKKDPASEPVFREILGAGHSEGIAEPKAYTSPAVPLNLADTEAVNEKSATPQAYKDWPVDPREKSDIESPYLSPGKSERPYVYGSLSDPRAARGNRS